MVHDAGLDLPVGARLGAEALPKENGDQGDDEADHDEGPSDGDAATRVADDEGRIRAGTGWTDIFIRPPYRFRAVDRLITNFHLPRSTLLMLVSAFAGYDRIMDLYRHAIAQRYRFFSYGDAMLLARAA